MTTTPQRQRGSHAAGGEAHRNKFPWWLLLLGLAILALLVWLLLRGGDDSTAADANSDATAQQGESSGDDSGAASAGGSGAASAGGGDAAGTGQLTVGGTAVIPGGDAASIKQYDGDQAVAKNVAVESVVSDEGFWVGTADNRVFVHLVTGGDESGPQVKAGDRVDFTGPVKPHGADYAGSLGVEGNEGADELTQQGAHIEVPEVAIRD